MSRTIKRLIDVVAVLAGLLVLGPFLLLVAAAVRLTMGAPVLFRQVRPGLHGEPFVLYKFRTMLDLRDEQCNLLPDEQRLTPIGRFLRSTSVDELPELFNVLKGEMSLVGPRPLLMQYLPYFTEKERLRFLVRPGITGLAQVCGRNDLTWDLRIATDVRYVQEYSLWLDLQILFLTICGVLKRHGVRVNPGATMLNFDEERSRALEINSEGVSSPLSSRTGLQQSATQCTIRTAHAQDARAIYALMREAFGKDFLSYTIYQAPRAVRYLTELIAQGPDQSLHGFFVICLKEKILGYYNAIRRSDEWFLNYIAVDTAARGYKLGNTLLNHYEERGRIYGCRQLALDVFDSNEVARDWYMKLGYKLHSHRFDVRLALYSLAKKGSLPLNWGSDAWLTALREEKRQGFSKVECQCGQGRLTLGLIANSTCKLLDFEGVTLAEAIFAVGSKLRDEREVLILSSLPHIPVGWPVLSSEKLLRLCKLIKPHV